MGLPANKGPAQQTALGKVIGHVPTQLRPEAGKSPIPGNKEKTALGQPIAHKPTTVKRPLPVAPVTRGPVVAQAAETPRSWWPLILCFLLFFLLATGILGGALFWLLNPGLFFPRGDDTAAEKSDTPKGPAPDKGKPLLPDLQTPAKAEKSETPNGPAQDNAKPLLPDPRTPAEMEKSETPKGPAPEKGKLLVPDPQRPAEKKAEMNPANKPEVDEVALLADKLKVGTPEDKTAGVQALAALGDKARPAASALCLVAIDSNKELARAALQALEKVNPELYDPVFTLLVDGQAANHRKAIAKLRNLGDKAKPAVPVMIYQIQKCGKDLSDVLTRKGRGWDIQTLIQVIADHLVVLTAIGPESPQVVAIIADTTRVNLGERFKRNPQLYKPFRSLGIGLLGNVGEKRPEHRKTIIPVLVEFLEESMNPLDLASVDLTSSALLRCGDEAKEALTKKVAPLLKELEFHNDANVRSTAKSLLTKIEAAPGGLKTGFPVKYEGKLAAGEQRTFPVAMINGKTYVIDLGSSEIDAYLHLRNPLGQVVAQDDDSGGGLNARIIFPCPGSGTYEIIASDFRRQGGSFILEVREQ